MAWGLQVYFDILILLVALGKFHPYFVLLLPYQFLLSAHLQLARRLDVGI
jgi:hypothetical protein